ncbi:MAG: lysophospholipid acyltransferase family protein, partial [Deltaproteobacteria bacterium]
PEGTRCRDGKVGSFKQGMFHLALQTGVPIVPISIAGGFEILNRMSLKVGRGNVVVVIGEAIETTNFTQDKRQELMECVRSTIINNCEKGNALLWQRKNDR